MARTTLRDKARKARIREHEYRVAATRLRRLDNITEEQMALLGKIKAAEATNKPVMVDDVPDWHALREMGVVKKQDAQLVLTSMGAQVVSSQQGGAH